MRTRLTYVTFLLALYSSGVSTAYLLSEPKVLTVEKAIVELHKELPFSTSTCTQENWDDDHCSN